MQKNNKRNNLIFGSGLIGVLILIFFSCLWIFRDTDNRSTMAMIGVKTVSADNTNIYQESPDVLGLGRTESSSETVKESKIDGLTPALAVIIDDLTQKYADKDYELLYDIINQEYLRNVGVVLNKDMFQKEQEKIFGDQENEINLTRCVKLTAYTLCEFQIGENGSRVMFTLFPGENEYTYLPFNIEDLFIVSDYGVSRIIGTSFN